MQNEITNIVQKRKGGTRPVQLHKNPVLNTERLSITIEKRFFTKVEKSSSCWIWVGAKTSGGYGSMRRGAKSSGDIRAHCASYLIHNGPIPKGQNVLHECDNPVCVNPAHLFLGTLAENSHDMMRKGRGTGGENNSWHILTWPQVRLIKEHYDSGGITQKLLAEKYGVDRTTISKIITGRNWKEWKH